MKDVFISHVEEDGSTAELLAAELAAAGYSSWLYERDTLVGQSYLSQTRRGIDESRCFILLISPAAIERGHQIDRELVHAHELDLPIIPILKDIDFRSFQEKRPDWHQAIGAIVGVCMSGDAVPTIAPRIIDGLTALGLTTPAQAAEAAAEDRADNSSFASEDAEHDTSNDEIAVLPWDDADGEAVDLTSEEPDGFSANIVHEHAGTGFLADLVMPDDVTEAPERVRVTFSHPLIKPGPCRVEIQVPRSADPVQYLRLPNMIHGYPVVLRVHWLARLPEGSTLTRTFGVTNVPSVRVGNATDVPTSSDSAGILVDRKFIRMVGRGVGLPYIAKKRFRTTRDNQKAMSIVPAVKRDDSPVRRFRRIRIFVPPAPAGIPWVECAFRVDPDGRYTIIVRDPLRRMQVRDMVIVQ